MKIEEATALLTNKIKGFLALPAENQKALAEYYTSVYILANKELNLEFNNKDSFHASIVMSSIFEKSNKSLQFFSGSFKGDICDQPLYLDALKTALNKDITIDIIFENNPNADSECYKLLKNTINSKAKISVSKIDSKYLTNVRDLNIKLHHFLIGDDKMFRYEFDGDSYQAYCNFDDKESVKILQKNFDVMKSNSISI